MSHKIRIKNGRPELNPGQNIHFLKTVDLFFREVWNENKTFEVRRDDRGFQIGDAVVLQEIRKDLTFTGREIWGTIQYIFKSIADYGVQEGFCIFQINSESIFRRVSNAKVIKSLEVQSVANELFQDLFSNDRSFPVLPWEPILPDFETGQSIILYENDENDRRTGRIISATINRILTDMSVLTNTGILIVLDTESILCIYNPGNQNEIVESPPFVNTPEDAGIPKSILDNPIFDSGWRTRVKNSLEEIVATTGDQEVESNLSNSELEEMVMEPEVRKMTFFVSMSEQFWNLFRKGFDYPVYQMKVIPGYLSPGDHLSIKEHIKGELSGRTISGPITAIVRGRNKKSTIVFDPNSLTRTFPGMGDHKIPFITDPVTANEWNIPDQEFIEIGGIDSNRKNEWRPNELRWIQNSNYRTAFIFLEDSFGHVAGQVTERDGYFYASRSIPYEQGPEERDASACPIQFKDLELAKRFVETNVSRTCHGESINHVEGILIVEKS